MDYPLFKLLALFSLLCIPAHAIDIDSCQTLSSAGATYYLNRSVNSSGATCFTIGDENITLDCNGYSITSLAPAKNIYGIVSDKFNTTIRNCNISGEYTYSIYFRLSSMNGSIRNTAISDRSILLESSHNNTLVNITSAYSGISLDLSGSHDNSISNSTMASTGFYPLALLSSHRNSINGLRLNASTGGLVLSSSENNTVVNCTLIGNSWVSDTGSGNIFNSSTQGNRYYFANGSGAWTAYNITDGNGDGWADYGSDRPFNSTTVAPYWSGSGQDFRPYTETAGPPYAISSIEVSPSSPTTSDNLNCTVKAVNLISNSSNVSIEWYKDGVNQTAYAGTYNGLASDMSTTVSTVNSSDTDFNEAWLCSVNVHYNSTNSSGWTNSSAVTITPCRVLSTPGETVTLEADASSVSSTCFTVGAENVTIDCNGYSITGGNASSTYGIYSSSDGTAVRNCRISNFDSAIYFYRMAGGSITNTTANSTRSGGSGIYLSLSNQSTLANLTAFSLSDPAVFLSAANSNTLSGISANSTNGYGLQLSTSANNNISNISAFSDGSIGIIIKSNSQGNSLSNATSASIGSYGISLDSANYNTLANLTATSSAHYGIFLASSSNNTLANLTATSTSEVAISLIQSSQNNLSGINASSSGAEAIKLGESSSNSLSSLTLRGTMAIYLSLSNSNNITNCSLTGSVWVANSGTGNIFNTSAIGNRYYFPNGTGAWAAFDILDLDGDSWADAGSALPFNATTVGGNWTGNGEDHRPFIQLAAIGNGTNISSSSLTNISVSIANTTNITGKGFGQNDTVIIYSGTDPLAQFNYNFTSSSINFSGITVENGYSGDKAYASISGINSSNIVGTKTMYIYNANPSISSVCIKDLDGVAYTNISSACTGSNETALACDGTLQGAYTCSLSGTTLTITGLSNSAAIQFAPPSSSTGGSGLSTPSLSYSFNCTSGSLSIKAASSTSPISGLEIRLKDSSKIGYLATAATSQQGIAQFSISESKTYSAESAPTPSYYQAYLPPFQLTLCALPSLPQSQQNQTQEQAEPQQPSPSSSPEEVPSQPEIPSSQQAPTSPSLPSLPQKAMDDAVDPLPATEGEKAAISQAAQPAITLGMFAAAALLLLAAVGLYLLKKRKGARQ